ncbi:MAG: alpha/beta fold hydrolase [Thermoleophilia bacterium]|nr:alpha/beta fold hydrolase [Thermoleophilia bacterium]
MSMWETSVRGAWRQLMRVAEHRIGTVEELGRALPGAGTDANPVLLVHGYGNNHSSMGAIERSLTRDGFRAFHVDLPEFGYGDALADARVVGDRIDAIRAATGAHQVDIVGHSRGGVVARTWQQLLDTQHATGRVVTVSSANQGLHLGPADGVLAGALPEGMQQIRRGASLIDDLAATRAGSDVIAVGTDGIDGIMVPASAARVQGAPWIAVDHGRTIGPLSQVGHYGILRDDRAYEAIRGALLRPRP